MLEASIKICKDTDIKFEKRELQFIFLTYTYSFQEKRLFFPTSVVFGTIFFPH